MEPLKEGTAVPASRVVAGGALDHPAQTKPADKAKGEPQSFSIVRIKLDGVVKTINGPVTGKTLRQLAGEIDGYPVTLKSGGALVPNNDDAVELKADQEFTTK